MTTHNLRAMLHYSRQLREFDHRPTRLWVVEEGFLVRREAGTFFRLLQTEENSSLASVRFEAVGPSSFARLAGAVLRLDGRSTASVAPRARSFYSEAPEAGDAGGRQSSPGVGAAIGRVYG